MRFALGLLAVLVLSACEARLAAGTSCSYASECAEPLTCSFGRCRPECLTYRDCPLGSQCFLDPTTGTGSCRLPDETACTATCPTGAECAMGTCAFRCTDDDGCLGTACDTLTGFCAEPPLGDAGVGPDAPVPTDAPAALTCATCGSGLCGAGDSCDPVVGVEAGALFTCLLRASGGVDCAGSDASGSLGDGAATWPSDVRPTFAPVSGDLHATVLALGWEHACVLSDGEIWCWGRGDFGQIGATAASEAPLRVLTADATDPYVSVAAGGYHTCVVHASGAIDCFGRNDVGQLGDGTTHGPCLGELECSTTPVRVTGISDAVAVDAYRFGTCAIHETGALSCWGSDELGVLGGAPGTRTGCTRTDDGVTVSCSRVPLVLTGLDAVTSVSMAGEHACAIDGGSLVCWGQADHGRLGIPADSLVHTPGTVTITTTPSVVEVGGYHSSVLGADGHVYAFGLNDDARLGRPAGSPPASSSPLDVPGLTDVRALAGGSFHTCALLGTGEVSCWGLDEQGQLGDGAAGAGSVPTPVVRD